MVEIILGHKGGIGKSTISAYRAEYLKEKEEKEVMCIDTDPENTTFLKYKNLNPIHIQIKDDTTGDIDKSKLDDLTEIILDNKDKNLVIDTGSTTYTPLVSYLIENDFFSILDNENIEYRLLCIVHGGGNTLDSINGIVKINNKFPNASLIVFNNELQASTSFNNKELTETKAYQSIKDNVIGIVNIPKKSSYIVDDITSMAQKRLLFSDLLANEDFKMMQKRRLLIYKDDLWNEFDKLGL